MCAVNLSIEAAEILENVFCEAVERDQPLSFHWRTLDPDLILSLGVSCSKSRVRNMAINLILTEAVLARSEGRWVSYSRHKQFYSGLRRYHGTAYTYATVLATIEELLELGLIEEERSSPGQRGWQSRFRATAELTVASTGMPVIYDPGEVVRLKGPDRNLINYADTDATCRMRRELRNINAALSAICLELPASDVVRTAQHLVVDGAYYRPVPPSLYRVFNRGSFEKGGRAYGWWQSLPKDRRRQLLINGEPTVEPDFVQMHASILYAERGHVLKGDAYETGEFPRDMGKLAFNVALNARTRQGAISALSNKASWPLSRTATGKLLNVMARRHAPIAADLHADRGITLMRLDSEITLRTVKRCIKAGIPALPIHDSMLAPVRHASRVAELMEESAAVILKRANPCKVSVFRTAVPQMPSGVPASSLPFPLLGPWQLDLFPSVPSFSEPIRAFRDRLGLSQRALGEKLGCRQPHIANVEKGRDRLGAWSRHRLQDLMRGAA